MDALSAMLRVVHLVGAIFISARFTAPWCYRSPDAKVAAVHLEPGADRVVIFHLITEGECFTQVEGESPLRLAAGDIVIFPRGDAHLMMSEPGVPVAVGASLGEVLSRRPREIGFGGGGPKTRLICGYLACDENVARILFTGMPSVIRVNVRSSEAGLWLESSIRYALREARSARPGGTGVLAKLAEVLFIEAMRLHMSQNTDAGWLAGVGDRVVGRCLSLMHERPSKDWTLQELARQCNTSRSVLAVRFQSLVGQPVKKYLTQIRMLTAANLLRTTSDSISQIAGQTGYQTDSAFIRAFKREFTQAPIAWRQSQRNAKEAAKGSSIFSDASADAR